MKHVFSRKKNFYYFNLITYRVKIVTPIAYCASFYKFRKITPHNLLCSFLQLFWPTFFNYAFLSVLIYLDVDMN